MVNIGISAELRAAPLRLVGGLWKGGSVTRLVSASALEFRSVSIERGGRVVVSDVSLSVPHGCIAGLIGPSGCGKTTIMRAVVGVQAHVEGQVVVRGGAAGEASRLGEIGYVSQDPSVYGDLSVAENLRYFAGLLAVGDDRVRAVLDSVRLVDEADRTVDGLSGGQRARVSLAIALLNAPPLLVLDEPTVGLDPVLRRELWDEFRRLADAGTTMLVSSHVMDEARRCDWLFLMREGRILAEGTPADLMERTGTGSVEEAFLALVDEGNSL